MVNPNLTPEGGERCGGEGRGCRVWGVGFGVECLGCRVQGLGGRVEGLGLSV